MARNELKYMEAAIAVAEELSFSRAAKRLHLSQPAVTKHIAELEESLGVVLFVRDHHLVSLTDAGRAYVEEARIAVLHAHRAVQAARAAGQKCGDEFECGTNSLRRSILHIDDSSHEASIVSSAEAELVERFLLRVGSRSTHRRA